MDEGVGFSQGDSPPWHIGGGLVHHANAVNDGAHTETESTTSAVRGDMGEVGLRVKGYSLVSRIIANHVTFAAVDAHVFIDQSHHLLGVVQVVVCPNARKGTAYHILQGSMYTSVNYWCTPQ